MTATTVGSTKERTQDEVARLDDGRRSLQVHSKQLSIVRERAVSARGPLGVKITATTVAQRHVVIISVTTVCTPLKCRDADNEEMVCPRTQYKLEYEERITGQGVHAQNEVVRAMKVEQDVFVGVPDALNENECM